jgi:hypothetical protein
MNNLIEEQLKKLLLLLGGGEEGWYGDKEIEQLKVFLQDFAEEVKRSEANKKLL